MAFDYKNIPVLSKVKIGDTVYYLKDAELRALVDAFGDAVNFNVDTTFAPNSENLATSKAIAAHLEQAIAGLNGAMHFIGVKDTLPATANDGDVVIVGTAEYVYFNDGNEETSNWVLVGDEGIYATIAGVDQEYIKKTLTIAGIDLKDAITAEELKTALNLKALAYKDNASGTIETIDAVTIADHTPAGKVTVTLSQTSTAMASSGTYTPAGNVSGTNIAKGSVSISRDDVGGTQISGTVSAPAITVTPTTADVQHINSVGKLASYTASNWVAPSVNEAKSAFATAGIIASVDTDETLVFTNANTSDALTSTGFAAGSYTPAVYTPGELPSLGEAMKVITGVSASASAPTFTGDRFGAAFTGESTEISATFAGTEGNISVSGNYDKAGVEAAAFEGTAASVTAELTKTVKTITVQ